MFMAKYGIGCNETPDNNNNRCAQCKTGRQDSLRYGPGITRMVEGQLKRIEVEDKEYITNIQVHELDGWRG